MSKENLHFDQESKQIAFSIAEFYEKNKRNFQHFYQVIETPVEVWVNLKNQHLFTQT